MKILGIWSSLFSKIRITMSQLRQRSAMALASPNQSPLTSSYWIRIFRTGQAWIFAANCVALIDAHQYSFTRQPLMKWTSKARWTAERRATLRNQLQAKIFARWSKISYWLRLSRPTRRGPNRQTIHTVSCFAVIGMRSPFVLYGRLDNPEILQEY